MDILDRLNDRLLQALAVRASGPDDPFTIGEIYQQLIPYRAMRAPLGLMELAPYEQALLRLLAGERGYLTVMQPGVAREIRRELDSPNPILGIYRDYADVELRLGAVEIGDEIGGAESATDDSNWQPPGSAAGAPEQGAPCVACREPLPLVSDLRYCPACGADQRERPCAACGAAIRAEWNFCIRCGKAQRG